MRLTWLVMIAAFCGCLTHSGDGPHASSDPTSLTSMPSESVSPPSLAGSPTPTSQSQSNVTELVNGVDFVANYTASVDLNRTADSLSNLSFKIVARADWAVSGQTQTCTQTNCTSAFVSTHDNRTQITFSFANPDDQVFNSTDAARLEYKKLCDRYRDSASSLFWMLESQLGLPSAEFSCTGGPVTPP